MKHFININNKYFNDLVAQLCYLNKDFTII